MELAYRLLNVFTVAGDRLSGNPLCVFEDGRGLEPAVMQALARQLNLSETTFVLPATRPEATARVRIFTPDFEMPFAGHPTLGTAQVVRALTGAGDTVTLEMAAGLVEVRAEGERWTLRAARAPVTRPPAASPDAKRPSIACPFPPSTRHCRSVWMPPMLLRLMTCSRMAISGPAPRSRIGWNAQVRIRSAGQRLSHAMRRSCSSL